MEFVVVAFIVSCIKCYYKMHLNNIPIYANKKNILLEKRDLNNVTHMLLDKKFIVEYIALNLRP